MFNVFRMSVEWVIFGLVEWYHRGSIWRGLDTVKHVCLSSPTPVTYYWPSRGGTSDVVPQCCMLCLYVYGFQQHD